MDTTRDLDWSGEHLSYKEKTTYIFMAKMSNGTLNDVFATVYLPAAFSYDSVRKSTKKTLQMETATTKRARTEWSNLLFNVTVSNYFYDG